MPMRQDCKFFESRTYPNGDTVRKCDLDLAPEAPWRCPENLNVYIKRRESFRKFAASVPEEAAEEYFETSPASRYLATVSRVKPAHRKTFESALLDGERIRLHVVRRDDNRLYWELLNEAGRASGLPVLYNTSFNLFGEPLVSDPRSAVRSFYASGIDALFVGNFLLEK